MNRFIVFCLLFYSLGVNAQWRGLQLHEIGPENGLGFEIYDIAKDSLGYLYLAGSHGLSRYDGNNVLHFQPADSSANSISPGPVYCLEVDSSGNIWVGMYSGKFHKYNPVLESFESYDLSDSKTLGKACVSMLIFKDNLWIGSNNYTFYQFNIPTKKVTAYIPDGVDLNKFQFQYPIEKVKMDIHDSNKLWLSIRNHDDPRVEFHRRKIGLFSFDINSKKFESQPSEGIFLHQTQAGKIITSDFENQYLIFDPQSQEVSEQFVGDVAVTTSKRIKSFLQIDDQRQWVVQGDQIVERNKLGQQQTLYTLGIGEAVFTESFRDESFIWFATERGMKVYDPSFNHIKHFSLSKFGEYERVFPGIMAFDEVNEILYLAYPYGNSTNRIYRIYMGAESTKDADFLTMPSVVEGLGIDHEDNLWAFGLKKFYRFINDREYVEETITSNKEVLPGHCFYMEELEAGLFAMPSKYKIHIFNAKEKSIHSIDRSDLTDPALSNAYLGNFSGVHFFHQEEIFFYNSLLFKYNLSSKKVKQIGIDNFQKETPLYTEDFLITKDKTFWLSFNNSFGEYELVGDSLLLIRDLSMEMGIPKIRIFDLHEDHQGRIWCFGSNGLIALDKAKEEVRFFGKEYGLPDSYIESMQVIEISNNRLCTVNKNGIIVFHPDSLWHSFSAEVPVVVNEVKVDGEKLVPKKNWNVTEQISLPTKKNVSISFQGLKLPYAGNLNYAYRLRGLDKKWTEIGSNNTVYISGLDPGDYTFEVKTGLAESKSPIKQFYINVPTPFLKSWWFISLLLLGVFLILAILYHYRIKTIKIEEARKTAINRQFAKLELKALRSQMNPHFMFNSLNSIKNYILKEKPVKAAEYLSNFSHLIRLILQNSTERTISLKEEIETLSLYVNLEQLRVNHAFDFSIEVDENINPSEVKIPPMIIQPFVENSIWHGLNAMEEGGKLLINIAAVNGHIEIEIDDNGIGRKKAMELKEKSSRNYKSMGMNITRDRLKLLQDMEAMDIRVEVIDKPDTGPHDSGTKVVVKLPA